MKLLKHLSTSVLLAITLSGFANHVIADDAKVFDKKVSGVPAANPEAIADNKVSPEFTPGLIAQGLDLLENPSGVITKFGYLSDNTPTEPDENTYLVLDHNPGGPTSGYDYGRHFLFQGHENANDRAYVTRINLDVAHPDHRITLLTPGAQGVTGFNRIDGSTWDPFSKTLLLTQEGNGSTGGVIEVGSDWDSIANAGQGLRTLYGSIGRGGFEGIHPDDVGNLLIVEDQGGTTLGSSVMPGAFGKNPNSFIYRFVPKNPNDLSAGKLQALQVSINGTPLTFVPVNAANPTGDVLSDNQLKLHTIGTSWPVRWVTIHDTDVNGTAAFDANAAAKTAGATPFKRPENGQFVPDSKFQSFVFVITGDTDNRASSQPQLAARGSWGGVFQVDLDQSRNTGMISLIVLGDADHNSFDNVTFADKKGTVLVAEDRGDTLHDQLNKLDSVWAFALNNDPTRNTAARLVALGADNLAGQPGAEDNEPTGIHMSDGDPTTNGLLGTKQLNKDQAMLFFTQQHGENNLFEIFSPADH
ncbi:MAG TPA: alkaline phosphatase PhoX [Chthoniobacterales bacterium]|nr:alkaline phosphatase PhoX [Chthoniobacterales bacterium]